MARNPTLEANDYADLRTILRQSYGNDVAQSQITAVASGTQSYGYQLTLPDGQHAFFKLSFPSGAISESRYADTPTAFTAFLASHNVPVAQPYSNSKGRISEPIDNLVLPEGVRNELRGYRGILTDLVVGHELPSNISALNNGETYAEYANQAATIIGKIHNSQQKENFTLPVPTKPSNFSQAKENILQILGFSPETDLGTLRRQLNNQNSAASQQICSISNNLLHNAGRMSQPTSQATLTQTSDTLNHGFFEDIVDRLITLEQQQEHLRSLPQGICHGDCSNNTNFLCQNGEITAIIDFDEMYHGALVSDVNSLLVNSYTITDFDSRSFSFDPDIATKTLRAYENERTLTNQELAALPALVEEYKLVHLYHNLSELTPYMQSTSLTQEQAEQQLSNFDTVMFPYRQIEEINDFKTVVNEYRHSKILQNEISLRQDWSDMPRNQQHYQSDISLGMNDS